MVKKILFTVLLSSILVSLDVLAQVELYPLSVYSVGQQYHTSNSNLKFANKPQSDTLTIPFIEDFSGPMVPIKNITVVPITITDSLGRNKADTQDSIYKINRLDTVYQIQHLKMHGLDASEIHPIFIYNVTFPKAITEAEKDTSEVYGKKYAKVINKYTIEIYNDVLCNIPVSVFNEKRRMFYCNWLRSPTPRYSTYPDTLAFLDDDGGVFINDDMAINAPSAGVATFDGVNYKGVPYASTPASGYADKLTSLPFYLDSFNRKDSLGLSFYYQSKSLGDSPLGKEFLTVDFKTSAGVWNEVWRAYGNPSDHLETFRTAYIPIDSIYLYKGFQYRIRNYGILNGRFSVWNVDYIYINKKMTLANSQPLDISFSSINKNCLQNYTSIPYRHFKSLSNPTAQLVSPTRMRNRNQIGIPIIIYFNMFTTDNLLDTIARDSTSYYMPQGFSDKTMTTATTVQQNRMNKPYILRQNFFFTNADTAFRYSNTQTEAPVDMSFNNYRRNETLFYDYYAYDDGTPEISMKLQQAGGVRLAHQYTILQKDTLTHLDFGFLKNNGTDLSNLPVFMTVWNSNFSEVVKNGQKIAIKYSTDINGFVRYEFSPHIILEAGTYYFGLRQEFNYALFIGYDRNNDRLNKIFTSLDGIKWTPFSSVALYTGALMIRPVFSKEEKIVTSVENPSIPADKEEQFILYPNPAQSIVYVTGNPTETIIYDLNGQVLLKKLMDTTNNSIQIENLSNGIYVVAVKKNDYTEIKRLIVQK